MFQSELLKTRIPMSSVAGGAPRDRRLWKDVSAGAGAARGSSLAQLFRTDSLYYSFLIHWCNFNTNSNPCVALSLRKQ